MARGVKMVGIGEFKVILREFSAELLWMFSSLLSQNFGVGKIVCLMNFEVQFIPEKHK